MFDQVYALSAINTPTIVGYVNSARDIDASITLSARPTFTQRISGVSDYCFKNDNLFFVVCNNLNSTQNYYAANSYTNEVVSSVNVSTNTLISLPIESDTYNNIPLNFYSETTLINPSISIDTLEVLTHDEPRLIYFKSDDSSSSFTATSSTTFHNFYTTGDITNSDRITFGEDVWFLKRPCDRFLTNQCETSSAPFSSLHIKNGVYHAWGKEKNNAWVNNLASVLTINNTLTSLINVDVPIQNERFLLNTGGYLEYAGNREFFEDSLGSNFSFNTAYKRGSNDGCIVGNINPSKTSGWNYSISTGPTTLLQTLLRGDTVYTYNTKDNKIYQKTVEGASFTHLAYTINASGNRWIYDNNNKKIHLLNIDNLIQTTVTCKLPVTHMECDYTNSLWIRNANNYLCYNTAGKLMQVIPHDNTTDSFYIPLRGVTPVGTNAQKNDWDGEGNIYTQTGNNLRKNGEIYYTFDKLHDFFVDHTNNVWVFIDYNTVGKITPLGDYYSNRVFDYTEHDDFSLAGWMDGDFCIKLYNNSKNIIYTINEDAVMTRYKKVKDGCGTSLYKVKGYTTDYSHSKRCNYLNGFASKDNVLLTLEYAWGCLNRHPLDNHTNYSYFHTRLIDADNYNSVGFIFNNAEGYAAININGNFTVEYFLPQSRTLRYTDVYDPHRYNSLLFGTLHGKRSTIHTHLYSFANTTGEMTRTRFYDHPLTYAECIAIYRADVWYGAGTDLFDTPYIEQRGLRNNKHHTLHRFLRNGTPLHASNVFDINVWGVSGSDELNERIKHQLEEVKPLHTILRNIHYK